MQRGEVDGYLFFYSSLMATQSSWVKDGSLKLLVQYGQKKEPAVGDVPFASDLVKTAEARLLLLGGLRRHFRGAPLCRAAGRACRSSRSAANRSRRDLR